MKEKDFQVLFSKWISDKKHMFGHSTAFELKIINQTDGKRSLYYANIKPHQVEELLRVKTEGVYHKISDSPIFPGMKSRFTTQKPFDCFLLKGNAYFVLLYYRPRQPKLMHFIEIDAFVKYVDETKGSSLPEEDAKRLAQFSYILDNNEK
jgi:penicillin-binding protein-related factor A (putative recombinase)